MSWCETEMQKYMPLVKQNVEVFILGGQRKEIRDGGEGVESRAGVDSPTSPTLAGPYFRGALIRWAWHHRTKSDQIDGWSVQLLS